MDIVLTFQKYKGEFLEFGRIVDPRHRRRDLCAFLLLDDCLPTTNQPMVSSAEHDCIYLVCTGAELASGATEDVIRDLVRCGVICNDDRDQLYMYA
jgi:hypothetical protein